MKTEEKKKQDRYVEVLSKICGNSFDCSKIIKKDDKGFTAAIGSSKQRYFELFKYTYQQKRKEVVESKTGGSFNDFVNERATDKASS